MDVHGQIVPGRLNWAVFARALPLHECFKQRVPDQFISQDMDDEGPVYVIACPCGEEPQVPVGHCVECACERFYLAGARSVLVANSPQDRDEQETSDGRQ